MNPKKLLAKWKTETDQSERQHIIKILRFLLRGLEAETPTTSPQSRNHHPDAKYMMTTPNEPEDLLAREKLTKKFFLRQMTGHYLVSNCGFPSIFEEEIAPVSQRNEQWKRIVAAGANGRYCYVFQSPVEAKRLFDKALANTPGNRRQMG